MEKSDTSIVNAPLIEEVKEDEKEDEKDEEDEE